MKFLSTIKAKITGALLVFALLFCAIFISTLVITSRGKFDALIVNIAGRQRMLSQKMTKESLAYVFLTQSDKIKKESIQKAITLFDLSLTALTDGGSTFSDSEMKNSVTLPSIKDTSTRDQLIQVKELWDSFKKKITGLIDSKSTDNLEIEKLLALNSDLLREMDKAVGMLQKNSEQKANSMIYIQIIGLVLFTFFCYLLIATISRNLGKPVSQMVTALENISNGDLTTQIESRGDDEISYLGMYINKLMESLSVILKKVKDSSHGVASSTDEIAMGSDDLARRTSEEAASITQTSATLEELTSIVKQNKTNSEEIGASLESFNQEIQSRNELMTNVTTTMSEIHESSRKIDAIVNVINDISFQTNLLALNAAVEAARAGEAGRGFAVVASEVRNLAQKTAESSKTIQSIVSQNVESTERGMELVKKTTDFFTTITRVMQDIVARIEQITDGSKQQATGVEQINIAVSQLENDINQNASLVEELSATARAMKGNSDELLSQVDRFNIDLNKKAAQKASQAKKSQPASKSEKKATETKPAKSESQHSKKAEVKTDTGKKTSPSKPETTKKTETPPAASKSQSTSDTKKAAGKEPVDDFFSSDEEGFEEF